MRACQPRITHPHERMRSSVAAGAQRAAAKLPFRPKHGHHECCSGLAIGAAAACQQCVVGALQQRVHTRASTPRARNLREHARQRRDITPREAAAQKLPLVTRHVGGSSRRRLLCAPRRRRHCRRRS
eukprot:361438-Chlamydomonas_euryale.AAC.2